MYTYNSSYLKQLRFEASMTQKQLATTLNLSIRHIARIECGQTPLTHQLIMEYATIFPEFDISQLYVKDNNNN